MKKNAPRSGGILVCGHGSRDPVAHEEFLDVVAALRSLLPGEFVAHGFLELTEPSIDQALAAMYRHGCWKISVLPGMLFAAAHVKEDIPQILATFQAEHRDVEFAMARELGLSENLIEAAVSQINETLAKTNQAQTSQVDEEQTLLLVAGRGSRDVDALAKLEEITARLQRDTGLGHSRTCYANVATPLVNDVLTEVVKGEYRRIVFLPWFLFTGVLTRRLQDLVEQASRENPAVEFVQISHFGNHPMVARTFAERYRELG